MAKNYLDQTAEIEVKNPTFRAVVEEFGREQLPKYLEEEGLATNRAFVFTDTNVGELYGPGMIGTLEDAGIDAELLVMEAGEKHKTLQQVGDFVNRLADAKANRNDTIIALGGGVVGDLVGLVAATYKRGLPLVHAPTTLLAMVDSSIGGKTGVDHGGKNMMGAFYQPSLVVADPIYLASLDDRTYIEGLGEVAKYAVLDGDFLPELEAVADQVRLRSGDASDEIGKVVARCVNQKTDVIMADPFEDKPDGRVLLNYGHTLGHGLEAAGGYTELLHGEAVSIGMMYVAGLARTLGLTDDSFVKRQEALLRQLGLPTKYQGSASLEDILTHVAKDKKNTGGSTTRFVLPLAPGVMQVQQVRNDTVRATINDFLNSYS